MGAVLPDPKPEARIVATRQQWQRMREAKLYGKRCRCCEHRAATLHHLVPKSLGGDDVLPNLIPLCGDGTLGCHGAVEASRLWARERVRRSLTDDELEYVVAKKSASFLEHYYPWPETAA